MFLATEYDTSCQVFLLTLDLFRQRKDSVLTRHANTEYSWDAQSTPIPRNEKEFQHDLSFHPHNGCADCPNYRN